MHNDHKIFVFNSTSSCKRTLDHNSNSCKEIKSTSEVNYMHKYKRECKSIFCLSLFFSSWFKRQLKKWNNYKSKFMDT